MMTTEQTESTKPLLIAFYGGKGGTGKTTLATQTAVAMKRMNAQRNNGKKLAFYDLDKQRTASWYLSTIDEKYRPDYVLTSLDQAPPDDVNAVLADFAPNVDVIPPRGFLIVAPTASTSLDMHAFRHVIELREQGYPVIPVLNKFNQIRTDDKALLNELQNVVVITANSGITHAMNNQKSIWNSNHPGGRKAKNQFAYLIKCIKEGKAPKIDIETVNAISAGTYEVTK